MEEFDAEIYDIVRQIPPGRVVTYGQLARLEGLPCHRVVNSSGRLAPGWPAQRELLEHEGVTFRRNGCVDLSKHLWEEIAPIA